MRTCAMMSIIGMVTLKPEREKARYCVPHTITSTALPTQAVSIKTIQVSTYRLMAFIPKDKSQPKSFYAYFIQKKRISPAGYNAI